MMRHNLEACHDDFDDLSEALGYGSNEAASFPDRLDWLCEKIGLPIQLKRVAVPDNVIEDMARDAATNQRLINPNPVVVDQAAAAKIYRNVLRRW